MKAEQHPAMLSQCCQLPSAGLRPGGYCQPVGAHISCIRVEGVGGSREGRGGMETCRWIRQGRGTERSWGERCTKEANRKNTCCMYVINNLYIIWWLHNHRNCYTEVWYLRERLEKWPHVRTFQVLCRFVCCIFIVRCNIHIVWWLGNHREVKHHAGVPYKWDRLKQENSVISDIFGLCTQKGSPVAHSPYNILYM